MGSRLHSCRNPQKSGDDDNNNTITKQVQGDTREWVSRAGDAIAIMMGPRGVTLPMTKGFIVLALTIATILLVAFLITVCAI